MQMLKRTVFIAISLILIFTTGCSVGASSQGGGLIISEVVTSNSNSLIDPVFGKPDWIELCNTSSSPINLLGYSLAESSNSKFEFPDVTIAPGEYMIIYCCMNIEGVTSDKLCTGFKLSKTGATLILSSSNSTIEKLDVPALETDISYGVTADGKYAFFGIPTPGAANTTKSSADLAGLESDKTVSLKINEVMPKAASNADYAWAEIFNAGNKTVELSDYYITEDLSDTTKARLPEKQLAAGEYAVVKFTGNSGADEVPFKLGSDETLLAVSNNFGAIIDNFSWDSAILPGMSAGRNNDSTVYFIEPNPGAENGSQYTEGVTLNEGTSDIRINEILLKNDFSLIDQDGDRSEWVELYNASQSTVSLLGYALSDKKDDPLKWRLPGVELGAGQYLIVFLSGKDRATGELHTNFSLGDGDTELVLSNINTGTMQTVPLPGERKNNISLGLSPEGQWLYYYQPTPSAENSAQGFADIAQIESRTSSVRINEVATVSSVKSGDPDWIELYNQLPDDMDLSGFFLSDDKDDLKKWALGDMTIKAGGYKVIDEYKNDNSSGEIKISSAGEKIYLSNSQGEVIDQFDTGVLRPGVSRGITSDNTVALFDTPTKGGANSGNVLQGYCAAPVFSVSGGYKESSFELEMSTATEGGTIHYTLDGSAPTTDSAVYNGPIPISKTTPVRAKAFASGKLSSDEAVATYLFGGKHSLPVVCLSISDSDKSYIFGSQKRDDRRERGGYVEYYEPDGSLGVSFPAGMRIAGNSTRTYAQKSINLYLRSGYGRSSVTYPFFEGYNITTFKSLSLRNMGQDARSRLRDVFVSMAVNGMNIDNMQSKFAVLYINGKYWGLYEFKENQNEDYLESKHGVDRDDVVMIRGNTNAVDAGDSTDIKKMYTLADKMIASPSNEEYMSEYASKVDPDYFMDYIIAATFFDCRDTYNQKFAHTVDDSLKWRPLFYDLDYCLERSDGDIFWLFNVKEYIRHEANEKGSGITNMRLFCAFMRNDEWRERFIKRYAEVLNTTLTTDNLLSLYDGMVDSIKGEMKDTIDRWGYPSSMSQWNDYRSSLRKVIENRRKYVKKQLQNNFDLSDSEMQELFPNG